MLQNLCQFIGIFGRFFRLLPVPFGQLGLGHFIARLAGVDARVQHHFLHHVEDDELRRKETDHAARRDARNRADPVEPCGKRVMIRSEMPADAAADQPDDRQHGVKDGGLDRKPDTFFAVRLRMGFQLVPVELQFHGVAGCGETAGAGTGTGAGCGGAAITGAAGGAFTTGFHACAAFSICVRTSGVSNWPACAR